MKNKPIHVIYTTLIFVAALAGYAFLFRMGAAGYVLPNDGVSWGPHIRGFALIIAGSIGLAVLAEWIAYAISRWLEEESGAAKQFSAMWVRGLILYFSITFASATSLLYAGRTDSRVAPYLVAAGLMVILLILQKPLYWIIAGKRYKPTEKIPARFIGSLLAIAWNLMGLYLVTLLHEQTSFFSAAGVVLIGFGMTLPTAIGFILFALLERTFSNSDIPIAKWKVSKSILYLSWFCFGFIARLSPTTLGRPANWAGLPSIEVKPNPGNEG